MEISRKRSIMSASRQVATAAAIAGTFIFSAPNQALADARDFNAMAVMEDLPPEQRLQYVAGVIEGLAYARFLRDNKKNRRHEVHLRLVFYEKKDTLSTIYLAFGQYPKYPAGAIVSAMIKQNCGE